VRNANRSSRSRLPSSSRRTIVRSRRTSARSASMSSRVEVIVENRGSLCPHARPAARRVVTTRQFDARLCLRHRAAPDEPERERDKLCYDRAPAGRAVRRYRVQGCRALYRWTVRRSAMLVSLRCRISTSRALLRRQASSSGSPEIWCKYSMSRCCSRRCSYDATRGHLP
jgi:hypothetical protein